MKSTTGAAATSGEVGVEEKRPIMAIMTLSAALIVVNGMLLAPWWILTGGLAPPWLALEAVLVLALFTAAPVDRRVRSAAYGVAFVLMVLTVIALADTTLRLSLGRPVNLHLDLWLLTSVRHLMFGTFGTVLAVVAMVMIPILLVGLVALVGSLIGAVPRSAAVATASRPRRLAIGLLALFVLGLAMERVAALAPLVDTPTARLVQDQSTRLLESINEREWFAERLDRMPQTYAGEPGLLGQLEGRDVIVGFLESYGVAAIEDPRYAPVVGARLDDFEARMEAAGLHVVSGKLVAPSQGGQSWFAHGSLLSGIWLDNQLRYDMMLASDHETLIDDFRRLGHRTVAVMPAISMAWPEGLRLGYDEIFSAREIPYEGPALNWVTMPDQFVWSFFEESVRGPAEEPVFAELGLISSHAPWTPILPVLDDWDEVGDGSIFEQWAGTGEAPDVLWRDTDRVREHYAMSVEYAVHAMVSYAERYVDARTLLIVMGDHQPAPLITGEGVSWDVPVHVVSGDPALVQPFLDWGFVEGAWPRPGGASETLGVDFFRDWFLKAYRTR